MTIRVAHDFTCPWCWIALKQTKDLTDELGVEFEWLGYELFPHDMEFPGPSIAKAHDPNRPVTPNRLELAYAAANMEAPPKIQPAHTRTHNAHLALEFAKTQGVGGAFLNRLYEAFWMHGEPINEPETLRSLASGIIADADAMLLSVAEEQFADKLVMFDDPAYASGVFNVPTFFIGGERYAEQPTAVLRRAIQAELVRF